MMLINRLIFHISDERASVSETEKRKAKKSFGATCNPFCVRRKILQLFVEAQK